MKQNNVFFIVALLATVLACNALTEPASSEPTKRNRPYAISTFTSTPPIKPTARPTNTNQPKIQFDIPVLADGVRNQCSAEKWAFRPIAIYQYSNIAILDFSVHNGSDFSGRAIFSGQPASLISQSGKWYDPFDISFTPFIPNNPHSPYSATQYQLPIDDTQMILPHTTSMGFENPVNGKFMSYSLGFEIPSDQKIVAVHFFEVQFNCQITQSFVGYSDIDEVYYSAEHIVINAVPTPAVTANSNNGGWDTANTNPLCQNDYYPVVKGAKWVYKLTGGHPGNSDDPVVYMLYEITRILPDGFVIANNFSKTTEFTPLDPTKKDLYFKWSCLPDGLSPGPGEHPIPKEILIGSYWPRSLGASGQGQYGDEKFTSLGIESIMVPAGTFDAVKVQDVTDLLNEVTYFDWYVKGIGMVKSFTKSSIAWGMKELVSYSIPK